jgi:hypothetical protein
VKSSVSLFLLVAHLFATLGLGELLKLPVFFAHLSEHRQENPELTISEFLVIHYASGNPIDEDYDRDMQLPFKKAQTNTSVLAYISLTNEVAWPTQKWVMVFCPKNIWADGAHNLIQSYFHSFWQPPELLG